MEFPVDVLEATSHGELEHSAHSYMNELLYIDPDHAHYFTLPSGKKVQISLSSVGFVPLYGANLQHKVLALFTPQDQLTAVALFLANQWYSMEDSLKTANSRREGLIKVRSVGERIVLYVLNRIVYRTNEMGSGEMPFLCHNENDYAKILWKNGQAVGFYSVKPKGSVCNNYLKQCYFLPVLDSIFVRKVHRGKGYGLQMLEDFVDSFSEDELGLKYPLSPAMTKVCRHYLDRYPADVDLFWEVESVGGPYQRTRVAYKLSSTPLNDTRKGGHAEDDGQNRVILEDQVEDAEETSLNITEEVIVVNKHHKITKELETPISTRTQSSEHRRRKRVRDEDEAKSVDSRPDKIHRLEMPEEEEEKADEPESEAHTETPAGADEDNTSAIQNNTGVEEMEEMEVKEVAEEYQAVVQKDASQTVDTLKEPAAEQQGVALAAEDNQKIEINSLVYLQQKKENAPAAEEEKAAENEQKVDAPEAKKQNVAPAAEEKQEIVNGAEKEKVAAPLSNEKQEAPKITEEVVAPVSEEKQEGASSVKKEEEVALAAKEMQEEAPAAKDKSAVTVKEQEDAPSVEEVQEVALEVVNEVDPATEKEEEVASDSDVHPEVEKQEVGPPASETTSSLTTDSEGEQGQEEAMDFINDMGVTGISEQSSQEKEEHLSVENEYNTLTVEEEEAAQKEDETEEEEENVNEASDISQDPPEVRTKAVPPSSKRTSKRLSKMTLEDGEVEQEKVMGIEKEEKKVMKEEETEHSSEEEEQVQDLPVTDKRVLRGKPKVIQTMQRTRGKRRGKM